MGYRRHDYAKGVAVKGWGRCAPARGRVLACLTGMMMFVPPALYAQAPPPESLLPKVSASSFVSGASDSDIAEAIRKAVQTPGQGATAFLKGKQLMELPVGELRQLTRNRNLAIEVAQKQQLSAADTVVQADAVFDSNLTFSLNFSRTDTYGRTDSIYRPYEKYLLFNPDQFQQDFANLAAGNPPVTSNFVCVIVDGQLVNGNPNPTSTTPSCISNTITMRMQEHASFQLPTQNTWSGSVDWSKGFQWGGQVSVGVTSMRRKKDTYVFAGPDGFLLGPFASNDPLGLGSRFPWTSTFSASFTAPLPYTRNFGEYGPAQTVAVKIAGIQHRQAGWAVQASINSNTGVVVQRYWALVGAVKVLQFTRQHRKALEAINASVKRLFDQGLVTIYDKSQVEAELENLRNQEQIAWSNYIQASNALAEVLDYDPDTVLLPVGYSAALLKEHRVDEDQARSTALENRYELKISQADIHSSDIQVQHQENQNRPELTFQASVFYSQSDTAFGYRSFEKSLFNLNNPDNSDYFVGITYRLPFGKVAEKSALAQARIVKMQAQDRFSQTELGITEQVNTAMTNFLSAQSRSELAKTNLNLAELAYEKAERLHGLGLATEFELLSTFSDLLNAKTAYVNALVQYQQAYALLKTSEGLYAQ